MSEVDPKKLKLAMLAVYQVKEGELLGLMLAMGQRLGLFTPLAQHGSMTAAELAAATATNERYVQEWLYAVTAAGLIEKDSERFSLTPEMAIVLGEAEHPAFTAGIFTGPPLPETVDRLAEAFRTGIGFGWNDHGAGVAEMQRAMGTNNKRAHLVSEVLTAMPTIKDKLESGARVIDVGCGAGDLAHTLAKAFPKSTVLGVDPSVHAIEMANHLRANSELDNLEYCLGTFDDLPDESADIVTTFDVLHDLPFPERAAEQTMEALGGSGDWLVADIKAGADFEANAKIPTRSLFYSMSVMYCMNSALSEPGGAGLGTLGLTEGKLREIVTGAGFSELEGYEFDFDVNNRYYHITT
ncbi:MAG: methyltransferase domain-containing protein [Acidimicrobiales bacterium]|nr:methyltransferase domain-containing protein [Acidimicrobiales bacterium]